MARPPWRWCCSTSPRVSSICTGQGCRCPPATGAAAYLAGLNRLAALLSKAGVGAPVMLAHSTVCGSGPDAAVRSAVSEAVRTSPRFLQGPYTDLLGDAYRRDGCHFNAEGLRLATQAWAKQLSPRLSALR